MKNILIILISMLPLFTFAGGGEKEQQLDISIRTSKNGKIVVTGLKGKDLKKLQKNINTALKDIKVEVTDGKEKHTIHFKAEINID